MMKYVFVMCIAVALMHESQAFKVITFQTGNSAPAPTSAPAPAANAVDPTALIQSVQSAIASKLQQVQSLVNSLVQQKVALQQTALNSLQSTVTGFKSNVSPPYVIRKQIYIGAATAKPAAAPETTTSVNVEATTTSN